MYGLLKSILFLLSVWLYCNAVSCMSAAKQSSGKTIMIQPLGDFAPELSRSMLHQVRQINTKTYLCKPLPMPAQAYYQPRNRYRADSIIHTLSHKSGADTVWIALTHKDISVTKGAVADWGVMGLGFRPGNACVASTFRVNKDKVKDQFFKIAIHELGHTQGLPHCPVPTCYMRDAEGGNPTDAETGFCPSCKDFLIRKGWQLN
ncbi:hypothetical protein D3C71_28550 [compost metagenome]